MLEKALFLGESVNVEYKVEIPPNSDKYMKTVVAFANGRGGHIYRGRSNVLLPQASWSIPGRCLRPLKACCPRRTWPAGWERGFRPAASGYTQP